MVTFRTMCSYFSWQNLQEGHSVAIFSPAPWTSTNTATHGNAPLWSKSTHALYPNADRQPNSPQGFPREEQNRSLDGPVAPVWPSLIPPVGLTPRPCLAWMDFLRSPHQPCPILQGGASQTRLQPMLAFTPFVPQSHSQPFLIPSAQEAGLYSFNIQAPLPLASIWVRTVRGTAAYQVAGDGVGYLFLSPPAVPWPQFWQWMLSSRLLCL